MSAPSDDVDLGDLSRFELRAKLGAGGMGVVHRAYDRVRRMEVALKTMRRVDGATLYQFKNEFRSLAGVVHRNLVTLYELHALGDQWCFTMELVEGCSFLEYVRPHEHLVRDVRERIASAAENTATFQLPRDLVPVSGDSSAAMITMTVPPGGSASASAQSSGGERQSRISQALVAAELDVGRLRAALTQLVEGVAALHRAGKLHRDLKPSNVLVAHDGRVVVCDFGLVAEASSLEPLDNDMRPAGTPRFMSPEQAANREVGAPSDWYSLGVILYVALTGRAPFEGNIAQIVAAKQAGPARPPRELAPGIPADLDALCCALLERDPAARPTGDDILRMLEASMRTDALRAVPPHVTFVGRDHELARLRDALAASRGDATVVVQVHGPSGIGKSALVEQFLHEVDAGGGAIVLRGRCYERESVPYKALDSLVDALASHLFALPRHVAERLIKPDIAALARLFPVLRRVQAIAAIVPMLAVADDPHQLRRHAFSALRELLVALAATRPTVICVDDLQWGDLDSAAFLVDLIENPRPPIGLLIVTYRSADAATSPLLRAMLGARPRTASDVRSIGVDPLSTDEACALAERVMGVEASASASDEDPRVAAVVAEAGGHPLFIAELARAAESTARGSMRLNLDDVLAERVARLPPEAFALLVASSVAGRPMPVSLIGRTSEISDEAAALATLQSELLVRTRPGDSEQMIEPYHDRIRETVVSRLPERDSRRVHRRLARALEATGVGDPLALVELWQGAGDAGKACAYAIRAAELAEETFAFDRAAHHYKLLLELAELDDEQRRALTLRLGDALTIAGRLEDAAAAYLAAADGADRSLALELERRAFEQLLRSGRFDDGVLLCKQVLAEIGLGFPRTHVGTLVMILLGRARIWLRGIRFQPRDPDAIDPELLRRVDVCWSVSSGLTFVDPVIGTAFQTRQLIYALQAGDPRRAAIALALEIGFRSLPGVSARKGVERISATASQIAADCGDPAVGGLVTACTGLAHILMGDFRVGYEGVSAGETAMRADATTFRWQIDVAHNYEVTGLFYLGRVRDLIDRVTALLRDAEERGDEYLTSSLRSWRSNAAWLAIDDEAEARRQLAEDVRRHPRTGRFRLQNYFRVLAKAQIDLYTGDRGGAWQRVSDAWGPLEKSRLLRIQTVFVEAHFLRARCALAAAIARLGDREARLHDVERCARALDKQRVPWASALAILARSGAWAARGESERAVAGFEQGIAACAGADLALFAAVARYRCGQVMGGDRGAALVADATAWMRDERIRSPERLVGMLAPG